MRESTFWMRAPTPRNSLENYKRLTASLRGGKRWNGAAGTATLGVNLDYTGSFDNRKEDPDLNNGNTDEFRSQYNRMALNVGFDYEAAAGGFFRSFEATAAFDYSADRIDRRRFVSISKPMAAPVNTEAGEFDAVPLDASYTAEMTVEGRPMSAYVKAAATFAAATDNSRNTFIAGGDWSMDKNFGRGQVVDLAHPLFSDWPRARDHTATYPHSTIWRYSPRPTRRWRWAACISTPWPAYAPRRCSTCRAATPCAGAYGSTRASTCVCRCPPRR